MELLELFHQGGLVMYPLLLCSIIAIAILVERVRTYRAAQSNMNRLREEVPVLTAANNQKGLEALCAEDGGVGSRNAYVGYLPRHS